MDENGTIATVEPEADQEETLTTTPKKPDVVTFKEIVARHLRNWGVLYVEDLCTDQTRSLIDELAEHFG